MKQTAVEYLEKEFNTYGTLLNCDFINAKEMEKQQLKSEQITKEHFRKQRDEGLLEQSKIYSRKDIINALHSVEVKYNRDFTKIYEGILEYLKESSQKTNIIDKWLQENGSPEIAKQVEQEAKELSNDLLSNLINLNKRAISENWKMKDVGEEFFKTFAYSENNNGWIKIESDDDLPKEKAEYLTFRGNGIIIKEWFYPEHPQSWRVYYNVTHYQPIVKPQLPIY